MGTFKYPPEVRERAVRLVYEWREARGRTHGGIKDVAAEIGVHHESLRTWLKQHEVDHGKRAGLSTEDNERIKELERETCCGNRVPAVLRRHRTHRRRCHRGRRR